ncbi:MAG: hypothetical protein ACYSWP_21395 [Planctomycetota bacterium]|jgi:hypothetical protein
MFEFRDCKIRIRSIIAAMFLLAVVPKEVLANVGTPFIWAHAFHLYLGNAIIGIVEGMIIARTFKLKKSVCVGVMILANYFSAAMGILFISHLVDKSMRLSLYNAWGRIWILVLFMYVATIAFEWPFILFVLRKVKSALRKSLLACFLVQTISYVCIFGWYWLASGTTLYTDMDIVQPSEISFGQNVTVYFIGEDGDVYSIEDSAMAAVKVFDLNSVHMNDRLVLEMSDEDPNIWRMIGYLEAVTHRKSRRVLIREGFSSEVVPSWPDGGYERQLKFGTMANFGRVPKLGQKQSDWEFWCDFWALGMSGENKENKKLKFSFETPFGAWFVRNATVLPDDKVIFQLGSDQICILEPESKKVALIARGRGPVVILKEINEKKIDGAS